MGCKGVPHVDDIDSSGCSLNTITIKKINENIAVLGFNLCSKFSKSNPFLNNFFNFFNFIKVHWVFYIFYIPNRIFFLIITVITRYN